MPFLTKLSSTIVGMITVNKQMKKIFAALLILLFFTISLAAQDWTQNLPQDKVQNGNLTFFEIQKAFNDYWEPFNVKGGKYIDANGELVKAQGWNQFRRWEWYWENRIDPATGNFSTTSAWEELQKHLTKNPNYGKSVSGNWESMGPASSPGGYAGLGRINCVAFHPTDNSLIYAGAATGGLWKTNDGGLSWTVLSDSWAVQGVSDICVVSGSPNTIYAATGDRENTMWGLGGGQNHDNNSVGVLVSTDGGASWGSTGLSFVPSQRIAINRMVIDPSNSSILYAATTVGVYKTTDAGANWSLIYGTQFSDMEFMPGTPSTIYGSSMAGDIYLTTDGGSNWTATLTTIFGRVEMAVTPANPNIVYAVMQDEPWVTPDESPVYKSTDGGASFSRIFNSSTISILSYECNGSDMNKSQASYDLCIAADPTNASVVFIGGINVWKSTDGGANWNISTHWSSTCSSTATKVHADQHYLVYQPVSNHLFLGNDGGLYKTANNGTLWSYIGSGLVTTQIYRIGVAQSVSNKYMLGAQDNGTKAFNSSAWVDAIGGDGMECIIDYTDPTVAYGAGQQGAIKRTTDYWTSFTDISVPSANSGAWVTPYVMDPVTHTTLYAGINDVWKSTNQGTSWTQISTLGLGTTTLRSLAVATSNSNYIYTTTQTLVYRTIDGGTIWANITGTLPIGSGYITYLSVKADDPNTAWVSLGSYASDRIYQTTDGGTTWTSISAGLPSVPVMCVIQNKQNTSRVDLYAATDIGVYVKAGTAAWQLFSSGLPTTLANELDIYYDANPGNSKIYAGTYGRGLWRSDLYESGVLNPTNVEAVASSDTQIDFSWALALGNNVMLAYNTTPTFGSPVNGTSYTTTIPGGGTVLYNGSNTAYNHTSLNSNTTYYYKIWSFDGSTTYSSGITASTSTFCTLISTFPWTEGFENGGVIPTCWTQEYVSGSNSWEMQTAGTNGHPASAHTGTYLARNRTTSVNAGYISKFVSPALNLSSVTSPFLTFWHTQEFWASQDELRVYYKTSINGSWSLLATYTNSIASWTKESVFLPNATSTYFIAFESTVNAGYGVCIDDVVISTSVADFTVDANHSCTGSLTVNFTDASIGPNGSWAWDVDNNNTTDYSTQNPTHSYSSPGLFSVKLTVNNGVATTTKENLILVMSAEPIVNTGCTLTSNSNSGNGYGIGIYRFALGNIDYTTSNNDGYYQNYSCSKWTSLELNKSYNITIQTGTSNNEGARVYIDYNDNGNFEAGESVVSFPSNKDGTRTLFFTTPSSGVVLDKGLRLRVLSKFGSIPGTACDISTYGQAEDYTVYILSDATWTGVSGTDWFTSGNWSYSVVPGSGVNAKIPSGLSNYPVLINDVTCRNLSIQSGASLTIDPGKALTVSGALANNSGTSGLIIKSDATGTGSLIHFTPGVNATMEQYLTSQRWHFVSPPVSGANIGIYSDIYFKKYNEPSNDWTYLVNPTTTSIEVTKGYAAWASDIYTGNTTVSYAGPLNSVDISLSGFSYSGPDPNYKGFHLIGNPFPCALDWNSNWTMSNMSGWLIIYDNGTSRGIHTDGTPWNGKTDGIIPSTQGFWVRALNSSASITIPASERVHSGQAFYKSASEIIYPYISLHSEINGLSDEALLIFRPGCTTGFDGYYDLAKFENINEAPNLFTIDDEGNRYAVNFYGSQYDNEIVPLGFKTGESGTYTISANALKNFDPDTKVFLEDLKTDLITELSEETAYEFYYQTGDDDNRFNLHFKNSLFGVKTNILNEISIYAFNKTVYIETFDKVLAEIVIYSLMGQEITRRESPGNELSQIKLRTETGFYIVKVQTDHQVFTEKVFIK